jgi:hypothetical protein
MLESIYLILFVINFILFFIGLVDVFRLLPGSRITLMVLSTVLFGVLAYSSFSIDHITSIWDGLAWQTSTVASKDLGMAALNVGLMSISLLYVIAAFLGWLPKENSGQGLVDA